MLYRQVVTLSQFPFSDEWAASAAVFAAELAFAPARALAADNTPGCGADNQKICTTSKAKKHGKVRKSKPSGAFFDPRKGGEYWSCPSRYIRNLNPVTHRAACTVSPVYACDSGNIGSRGKCYKKGSCGKRNGRPCMIVERFPSCNKGLAEDFIDNKCIPAKVAACLTLTRTIKIASSVGKAFDTMIKQMPGIKSNKDQAKSKQKSKAAKYKSTSQKKGLLKLASNAMKPYGKISAGLDPIGKLIAKGPKQITSFFKHPSYCTMAGSDREKRIAGFGLKPRVGFKKASLLDDLFIRSAHAASGRHFFMSYDLSISGGVGIGGSFGISFVTDYRGSNSGYISVGPGIVTNATIGGAFAIGFYPKVLADSFAGWGWSFGAAGGPFKVVSGGIDFFFDENFKVFDGFAVNIGAGIGISPVDANVSASYAWKL